MKKTKLKIEFGIALFVSLFLIFACGGEKIPLPQQPENDGTGAQGDTTYLQINPVWGPETGYDFNSPQDILLGREPLIYVADTGNNQVVMMDLAGGIIGMSPPIETSDDCPNPGGPVAIAQDSKLNLLIVTNCNKIYKIDLVSVNHDIANAPVELVFHEIDNPDRRFTGIASILTNVRGQGTIRYYVTATGNDRRDNQVLIFPESFDVSTPDAVNLEPNGLGILSASVPSGVTALRDFSIDFIFCMVGENSFKVQWVTGSEFGFVPRLNPANGNFDLFEPGKFSGPEDVTVDAENNIFVIDAALDRLFKFSSSGEELQSFGEFGDGERQFDNPQGVAEFDKTLYIADTGNNRILRFKLSTDIDQ